MDASLANLPFVVILAVASFIPVFADPTGTSRITLYLLAAGFLFLVLNVVRLLQAFSAGREFRSERH